MAPPDDSIWQPPGDEPAGGEPAPPQDEQVAPEAEPALEVEPGPAGDLGRPETAVPAGRRRGLLLAATAAIVLAGGGAAIGLAATSSSPSLSGMTPAQILATSLSAARSAGSFRAELTQASSSGSVVFDVSESGSLIHGTGTQGLTLMVIGKAIYLQVTAQAAAPNGLTSSGLPSSDVGKWIRIPSDAAGISSLVSLLSPSLFLANFVALTGPITRSSGGGSSSDVFLTGTVPPSSVTGTGAGDEATLEISGTAPFLPVKLSYSDVHIGKQVYVFSNWGEQVAASPPSDTIPVPQGAFPTASTGADVATQSNLQTAFTGAKTYEVQNNGSYTGLNVHTFGSIDTGLAAVPGTTASADAHTISLSASANWVVLAAWSKSGACFAIVDTIAATPLDGTDQVGTIYIKSPGASPASCSAATYAMPGKVPGSEVSKTSFPS